MKIPERNDNLKIGLKNMIAYINQFHDTKELNILEIGSWTGVSMEIFAPCFKHVVCVDPWESTAGINTKYDMSEVERIFESRMAKFDNIVMMKYTSKLALDYFERHEKEEMEWDKDMPLNNIKNMFDIIYIDGLHTYEAVKEDITLWKERVRFFLCGHDYWPKKFPGVVKAVNEVFGKPDKVFSDTSWLKKI